MQVMATDAQKQKKKKKKKKTAENTTKGLQTTNS
jgi:hypothetical protein